MIYWWIWVLTIILVVVGVLLVAKAYGYDKRYYQTDDCSNLRRASNYTIAGVAFICIGILCLAIAASYNG